MAYSYQAYKDEAERFCKENGFDTAKYNQFARAKLHVHMMEHIGGYYDDSKEAIREERHFGDRFWAEHMK